MFASEYRKMKTEELQKEIDKKSDEYVQIKEDIMRGKEKDVRKSLKLRREIAKMLTVLTEMNNKE